MIKKNKSYSTLAIPNAILYHQIKSQTQHNTWDMWRVLMKQVVTVSYKSTLPIFVIPDVIQYPSLTPIITSPTMTQQPSTRFQLPF